MTSKQEVTEAESFKKGPFSVLDSAMTSKSQVLVCCRNDKKLMGFVRGFDRHFNMIMEGVHEASTGRKGQSEYQTRYVDKVFLRGDNVIWVTKCHDE